MRRAAFAGVALLAAFTAGGCLSVPDVSNTVTLPFDFSQVGTEYSIVSADYPATQTGNVAPDGGLRNLPAPLSTTQPALYMTGTNATGGLFLMLKKYIPGLPHGLTYAVSMNVNFVTSYHSGCTTGLGPAVFLKAGVSTNEPLATADAQGVLRMNLSKGAGSAGGDFASFGDIRNGLSGCPAQGTFAERSTIYQNQPTNLTTDANGGFWLWVATESTAAGRHEIYFTSLNLRLTH